MYVVGCLFSDLFSVFFMYVFVCLAIYLCMCCFVMLPMGELLSFKVLQIDVMR